MYEVLNLPHKEKLGREEIRHFIYGSKLISRRREISQLLKLGPVHPFKTPPWWYQWGRFCTGQSGNEREMIAAIKVIDHLLPGLLVHQESKETSPSKRKRQFESKSVLNDLCSES